MEKYQKYIIGLLGIGLLVLFVINFSHIIAWLLISALIAMIGGPIVILLKRIKYKKIKIPDWLASLVSLAVIWSFVIVFFRVTIPLISNQVSDFQNIDVESISEGLEVPIKTIDDYMQNSPFINQPKFSTEDFFIEKITSIVSITSISNLFADISSMIWSLILSVFAITFISFFFLKDRGLFDQGVLALVPEKFEEKTIHVLSSIRNLISRYLIGIILQSLCMMILYITGLYIIGVDINLAVLIGIVAGFLNVIPYIGPWIGASVAFVLLTVANIEADFYVHTMPIVLKMLVVVASAQLIDNIVFQPLIFGKSVKAHPIEIFIIILVAGSLYGVIGMMLAIPTYTVIRVIAKEFFDQYKFVRKLTNSISTGKNHKLNNNDGDL